MRLAIIDPKGNVVHAWDTSAEGRSQIANRAAAIAAPGRFQKSKRAGLAAAVDQAIREFQDETRRAQ